MDFDLKIGDCFYKKNDKRKFHIIDFVEDDETILVIYKFYGIHKQWWHYKIEEYFDFNESMKIGLYTKNKGT